MPLKVTIETDSELRKEFEYCGRDDYSRYFYRAIIDLFEDTDTDIELDVIALCYDYTEDNKDEVIDNYSLEEHFDKSSDEIEDDEILDYLNDRTYAQLLDNGLFFYQVF